ncbi:MAG: PorT family protein [Bacteroidetes bacterium]|nr:PorT family protein [Bacteroidota bacterium]
MRYRLLIFFLSSLLCHAQDNTRSVFTLKPTLGLNGCQIDGDSYGGYNKLGMLAGVAVNTRLNKRTSVDIGFYFSQKGAKHNPAPNKGDFSYYRVNLNYVDIPVLLKFNLNPVYFISLGPSVGYLVSYSENKNYVDYTGMYPFNKFDAGFNIGLGRKMVKDKFFVEVRSSNSFLPIRNYGPIANQIYYPNVIARFFNKGLYNNVLTLMFSYKIDYKKKSEEQQP